MENWSIAAGLGALGFWLFIAAAVVSGVWNEIRKRDAQHETLRRAIESGQPLDQELTDKLLSIGTGSKDQERDLKVSGLITLSVAPGLAIFGWVMGISVAEELKTIMLAVAAIVASAGIGLLVASRFVSRWNRENSDSPRNRIGT